MDMPAHEDKLCPRCQTTFECKSGSIDLCQCSSVTLSADELDYLHNRYDDCLCAGCLVELKREYNEARHPDWAGKTSG